MQRAAGPAIGGQNGHRRAQVKAESLWWGRRRCGRVEPRSACARTELLTGSEDLAVSDSGVGAGRGRNPAAGRDTEELQDGALKGGLSLKGIAARIGQYAAPSTLVSLGAIRLRNEQEGGRHAS